MSEKLINRVGRIISGGLNSIVDAVENAAPEIAMEQTIREVDDAIEEIRSELGKNAASIYMSEKKISDNRALVKDLATKIELAITEAREDLATAAIAQQIDIEAQLPVLTASLDEANNKKTELEGYISALLAKKREMSNDLKLIKKAKQETENKDTSVSGHSPSSNADKAAKAFHRIMENQGTPSTGHLNDPKTAAQLQELDDMAHQAKIKTRLDEIKTRLGK